MFHEVSAVAIEMLSKIFNEQNESSFKRSDLGKYRSILSIRHNFKVLALYFVGTAGVKIGVGAFPWKTEKPARHVQYK